MEKKINKGNTDLLHCTPYRLEAEIMFCIISFWLDFSFVNMNSSFLYRVALYKACSLELKIAISHGLTSLQLRKCDHIEEMCRHFKVKKFLSCQHPKLSQGSCQENASKQAGWTHMPAKCCQWSSLIRHLAANLHLEILFSSLNKLE